MTQAHYTCNACGHEWKLPLTAKDAKGKIHNPASECPKCGSAYFKWTNFPDDAWAMNKIKEVTNAIRNAPAFPEKHNLVIVGDQAITCIASPERVAEARANALKELKNYPPGMNLIFNGEKLSRN